MRQVERVSGAGEILAAAAAVGPQPVVTGVVDSAKTNRRPGLIPFTGMVINDVEDHLDSRAVKRLHHRFEFRDASAENVAGREADVRREIAN